MAKIKKAVKKNETKPQSEVDQPLAERPEKAAIVIKETEEDVILGSGFTGDPDEFKDEIKKEAESGDMLKKFLIPLFVFILIGGGVGLATWYYARPEKTVPKFEEKIQTPPQVEVKNPETPAVTTPVTPATPAKKDKDYTIQEGDTLSSIANANGMTSQELASYNAITDVNDLHIGQVVKIPIK